jgi:peptide deformylase
MIYPIVLYGSPMLRKVAKEIEKNAKDLDKLVADMFETMDASDGVGLAAPQIGKSLRLFTIDTTPMSDDDPSLAGFRKAFINPKIVEESGIPWKYIEGCLSLPEIREEVERPSIVKIKYYDENFKLHEETYDGVKARVIQHEYDHLEGILLVDRISPLKRKILRGKLTNITKGKVNAAYKTRLLKV